jgi:hypothetical protein
MRNKLSERDLFCSVRIHQSIYWILYCPLNTLMRKPQDDVTCAKFRPSVRRHSELIPRARTRLIGMSVYEVRMFPRVTTLTGGSTRTVGQEKVLLYNTVQSTWSDLRSLGSVSEVSGCGFDDRRYNPSRGRKFFLSQHVRLLPYQEQIWRAKIE